MTGPASIENGVGDVPRAAVPRLLPVSRVFGATAGPGPDRDRIHVHGPPNNGLRLSGHGHGHGSECHP